MANNNSLIKCLILGILISFLSGCTEKKKTETDADTTIGGPATPTPTPTPGPTTITYAVTSPSYDISEMSSQAASSVWIGSHDRGARTLSFTHNADSVLCSHDNGANYAACDTSSTLVYTIADFTLGNTLKIKFTKAGLSDEVYSLNPASAFPTLSFQTCTNMYTVETSQSVADLFSNYINGTTDGMVICLNSGLEFVSAASFMQYILPAGVTIIGTLASPPIIKMNPNSAGLSLFSVGAGSNAAALVNLDITYVSGNTQADNKIFQVGGGRYLTLKNVDLDIPAENNTLVYISDGTAYIFDSYLSIAAGASSSPRVVQTENTTSSSAVLIERSELHNGYATIDLGLKTTATISYSKFYQAHSGNVGAVFSSQHTANTTSLTMSNNRIETNEKGIYLTTATSGSAAITATLNNNSFVKTYGNKNPPIFVYKDTNQGTITINSTAGESNTYCNDSSTGGVNANNFDCALRVSTTSIGSSSCSASSGAGTYSTTFTTQASITSCP